MTDVPWIEWYQGSRQRRSTARECLGDCTRQDSAVVRILPEDYEQVVEVLHAAVDHAEFHRSLELLCNHRLSGVHPQPRSRSRVLGFECRPL